MPIPKINKPQINIVRPCYAMASQDGKSAEIKMYGNIVSRRPTDWDGNEVEGDFIVQGEFLADLERVADCDEIVLRMNSLGGDAVVSTVIHNRLRELAAKGKHLTCIVDGVAMSGGSLIMCACDTVRINPSSLVMIHKCWTFLWGGYNADELRSMAKENDTYDRGQIEIYSRKTGLSDTVLSHMMADTTYMTGREAVSKGFADELIDDAEPLEMAASADGRSIFVRSHKVHLTSGLFAPDFIPTIPKASAGAAAPAVANTTMQGSPCKENDEGGQSTMAKSIEELRSESPELTQQLEQSAAADAVQAERKRMEEIDQVASLFSSDLVREAKYGETACDARELSFRAAQAAAKQGRSFMAALDADNAESGAQKVQAVPGEAASGDPDPEEAEEKTPEEKLQAARENVAAVFGTKTNKEG